MGNWSQDILTEDICGMKLRDQWKYAVMMEGLGSVTVDSQTKEHCIQAAIKNTSTNIRATVLNIDLHCAHSLSFVYLVGKVCLLGLPKNNHGLWSSLNNIPPENTFLVFIYHTSWASAVLLRVVRSSGHYDCRQCSCTERARDPFCIRHLRALSIPHALACS